MTSGSVIIVSPAASRRLTTPARARARGATGDDAQLAVLIADATGAVEDYCQRTFAQERVLQTFTWGARGAGLYLEREPVTAIHAVTFDGLQLMQDLDYALDGQRLLRYAGSVLVDSWYGRRLEVEYTGGYTLPVDGQEGHTIPAPVERAVALLAAAMGSSTGRDPQLRTEQVTGVGSFTYGAPADAGALGHPEAERLLEPYRWMTVA